MPKPTVSIVQKFKPSQWNAFNQHFNIDRDMNVDKHKPHKFVASIATLNGVLKVIATGNFKYDGDHLPTTGTVYKSFQVVFVGNAKTKTLFSAEAKNGAASIFDTSAKHVIDKSGDMSGAGGPFSLATYGSTKKDKFTGSDKDDNFQASNGADKVLGKGGNDRLYGEGGNDLLNGGNGDDYLYNPSGKGKLLGGKGSDHLYGGTGASKLLGGGGADFLYGSSGNSWLDGGSGVDRIFGGTGKEVITGGPGKDYIYGGTGPDTFRFLKNSDVDLIHDFEPGIDKIKLGKGLFPKGMSDHDVVTTYGSMVGSDFVLQFGSNKLVVEGATMQQVEDALI